MTYRELIQSCNYEKRAYKLLFFLSKEIKTIDSYISKNRNEIDFCPEKFQQLYKSQIPIERITGIVYFCGEEFILRKNVFCPRHETEMLVKELQNIKNISGEYIDICSGTGAIGITYLKKNRKINGSLLDICPNAIKNIQDNLKKHNVQSKVIQEDWLEHLNKYNNYQIISANFPYVGENDPIQNLEHDPHLSLFAKKNGWEHYELMINWLKNNKPWKVVILETNPFHKSLWKAIKVEDWDIQLLNDIRGLLRTVVITKKLNQ